VSKIATFVKSSAEHKAPPNRKTVSQKDKGTSESLQQQKVSELPVDLSIGLCSGLRALVAF